MPLNETQASAGLSSPPVSTQHAPSFDVLGIRFHTLLMADAAPFIDNLIRARKPVQISFANAQTVAMGWRDPEIQAALNRSHFTFPDGMSIVWGGRMLGIPIQERLAGPDVTAALCRLAALRGYGVFLLGTSDENLRALEAQLVAANPGLRILGMFSPPMCERFSREQSDEMVARVNASKADILLVGLSCPKQERWIAANIDRLEVPVSLGVGAAFDFLSGRIPRAPGWLQKRGLEWLFRLWCEPRRLWRRYLWGNLIFVSLLLAERARRWIRRPVALPR
jgi:N-acetylglucosaminyldiphosphoundecaprenol N-acetyl-beta-D-mannosaminyltransferase